MHRHATEHIRHQRQRHIKRRLKTMNRVWYRGVPKNWPPGRFAKWNTSCNCGMCNKQNWPDTRPGVVGAYLDFQEALRELVEQELV